MMNILSVRNLYFLLQKRHASNYQILQYNLFSFLEEQTGNRFAQPEEIEEDDTTEDEEEEDIQNGSQAAGVETGVEMYDDSTTTTTDDFDEENAIRVSRDEVCNKF